MATVFPSVSSSSDEWFPRFVTTYNPELHGSRDMIVTEKLQRLSCGDEGVQTQFSLLIRLYKELAREHLSHGALVQLQLQFAVAQELLDSLAAALFWRGTADDLSEAFEVFVEEFQRFMACERCSRRLKPLLPRIIAKTRKSLGKFQEALRERRPLELILYRHYSQVFKSFRVSNGLEDFCYLSKIFTSILFDAPKRQAFLDFLHTREELVKGFSRDRADAYLAATRRLEALFPEKEFPDTFELEDELWSMELWNSTA